MDYSYAFNRFPENITYNPLSIGIDIETGGHVFQLHFSNAVGMNERAFLSDRQRQLAEGDISIRVQLIRVFQIKKQKSEPLRRSQKIMDYSLLKTFSNH